MKPFSLALRQRVAKALAQGQTQKQVAQRFDVSLSTVTRWAKQFRETKQPGVKPNRGRPKAINPAQMQMIQEIVTTQKIHTLASLRQTLQQRGQKVSLSVLHKELTQSGFARKNQTWLPQDDSRQ